MLLYMIQACSASLILESGCIDCTEILYPCYCSIRSLTAEPLEENRPTRFESSFTKRNFRISKYKCKY